MRTNGTTHRPPRIRAEYVGRRGLLFRADCLDLLANMRENSVNLVFADPPFNLGKDYKTSAFRDNLETESYRSWCRAWLIELVRVLRPGGSLFLYHWPKWLIDLGAWLNTVPALSYKSWIALKMKSGFPIKGRLHPAHYGILYYTKCGGKSTFHLVRHKTPVCRHCKRMIRDYGGYRKKFERFEDEEGVPWIQISDFWEDTRPARQDKSRQNQVAELPLHIPERAILMASNKGDVILDCFAGGGSTLQAAQLHDRLWIGADIADTAPSLRRIATFFGTSEASGIPASLGACFSNRFLDYIRKTRNESLVRPIQQAGTYDTVVRSMEEYASKSKVLGF